MVSCQWRLTSGARAGQACGKGKKVFCKTHESKAKQEVNRLFRGYGGRDTPLQEYLSRMINEATLMIDVANGIEGAYNGYRQTAEQGMEKYSASWIAPKEFDHKTIRGYGARGNLNTLDSICDPRIVSRWLEEQLSRVTVRGGEIFPQQRITMSQLRGIEDCGNLFRRRMHSGKNFQHFFSYATAYPSVAPNQVIPQSEWFNIGRMPLPFFQNFNARRWGANYSKEVEIINKNFCWWLQQCINYAPDYTAAWNWFVPAFSSAMVAHLDYTMRGYDVEAIEKDLSQLTRAYRLDANETEQEKDRLRNTNRYKRR